jgi:hypothetical protein
MSKKPLRWKLVEYQRAFSQSMEQYPGKSEEPAAFRMG